MRFLRLRTKTRANSRAFKKARMPRTVQLRKKLTLSPSLRFNEFRIIIFYILMEKNKEYIKRVE